MHFTLYTGGKKEVIVVLLRRCSPDRGASDNKKCQEIYENKYVNISMIT
jgi:hypothetical protein